MGYTSHWLEKCLSPSSHKEQGTSHLLIIHRFQGQVRCHLSLCLLYCQALLLVCKEILLCAPTMIVEFVFSLFWFMSLCFWQTLLQRRIKIIQIRQKAAFTVWSKSHLFYLNNLWGSTKNLFLPISLSLTK